MESTLQSEWLPEGPLLNEANSSQQKRSLGQVHAKPHTEGKEWAIKRG